VKRAAQVVTGLLSLSVVLGAAAVVLGYVHLTPVLSGSMRPGLQPGDVVVTTRVPARDVRAGDVVVFHPPGSDALRVHRVRTLSTGPRGVVMTTKGDANRDADPWKARITGHDAYRVVGHVPWLGWAAVELHGFGGYRALALVLGLLLAYEAVRAGRGGRRRATA